MFTKNLTTKPRAAIRKITRGAVAAVRSCYDYAYGRNDTKKDVFGAALFEIVARDSEDLENLDFMGSAYDTLGDDGLMLVKVKARIEPFVSISVAPSTHQILVIADKDCVIEKAEDVLEKMFPGRVRFKRE